MSASLISAPIKLGKETTASGKAANGLSWRQRLRNPASWRKTIFDTFLWTMLGTIIILLLQRTVPGYPVIVVTESIPTGVYWLDRWPSAYSAGDYISFEFKPGDKELKTRYAANVKNFTKMVGATQGWVIKSDATGALTACPPAQWGGACRDMGKPDPVDSKGRTLKPWFKPGSTYALLKDEVWVYGPHARSLDSRYYGPVPLTDAQGKAFPLHLFKF